MTKEELAAKLNGREYMKEMTRKEAIQAKESGLVVIWNSDDNLMKFRGAIDDEVRCYRGGWPTAITPAGILINECDDEDCPYFARIVDACQTKITPLWNKEGHSWSYEADMPHATFDVMAAGKKYCRGIVVELPK